VVDFCISFIDFHQSPSGKWLVACASVSMDVQSNCCCVAELAPQCV